MSEILRSFAWQSIDLAVKVLPYFAIGVLIAGFLEVYAGGGVLRRKLLGRPAATILIAALLGAVIPICSCGVVPVVTGLIAGGVPLAPAIAFLVSAPMMNPATYAMTAGALGADVGTARLVCALALSIGAGLAVLALERAGWIRADRDVRPVRRICPCAWDAGALPRGGRRFLIAWLRGGEILIGFAKYLGIGIVLGAGIAVLVRPEWIVRSLSGAIGIPVAALVGVPLYICTCSEIPVALPLVAKGMSKAALVTFLLAGPGTSVFSLIMIASLFGKRLLIFYAGGFLAGSMILGGLAGLALGG